MKGQLRDKVAIVTGGGTGIGEAICLRFAREGAKIVVNGLPDDPIADVVTAILDAGGEAISVCRRCRDRGTGQGLRQGGHRQVRARRRAREQRGRAAREC